ncbi:4-hydroxy-2-oxovalerate aldolase [Betaproteobacteria bacterium]|nr:4-hydroxy-2-oxovalerate aldolase [Betaproteobacteria bacterium]
MTTTFRDLQQKKGPVLGLYLQNADPFIVEAAKAGGFDYIRIDNEHVLYDYSQIKELIRVAILLDMPCQVRVSDLTDITRMLDAGATGIVVPDVNTVERARQAVQATKYAPLGVRGMYPLPPPVGRFLRAAGFDDFADYVKAANEIVTLTVQIEDVRAASFLDEIISMPGVDMVASGKADISQSVGKLGLTTAPEVVEFEKLLVRKALEHGKTPTLMAGGNPAFVREMTRLGVKFFSCGPDEAIIANAFRSFADSMKGGN